MTSEPGETAPRETVSPPRRHGGQAPGKWRCGAATRSGAPCASPAVFRKDRCRKHGGAPGSGSPSGNRNAQKNGLYTRQAIADRRALRGLMRDAERLIEEME